MIIEFIGIPGSGKSYLTKKIILQLKNRIFCTREDIYKYRKNNYNKVSQLFLILSFFFNINFLNLVKSILFNKNLKNKRKRKTIHYIMYIILEHKIISKILNQKENLIFILDEAALHLTQQFFTKDKKQAEYYHKKIDKLISSFYIQKKLYIFVQNDMKTSIYRINNRLSGWPDTVKELDEKEKVDYLKAFIKKINILEVIAKENKYKYKIINNDNDNSKKDLYFYQDFIKKIDLELSND